MSKKKICPWCKKVNTFPSPLDSRCCDHCYDIYGGHPNDQVIKPPTPPAVDAPGEREELDHPCRDSCSGWKQGYEKGLAAATARHQQNEREISNAYNIQLALHDHFRERALALEAQLARSEAMRKELVEALAFYAGSWGPHHGNDEKTNLIIMETLNRAGFKAREALAKHNDSEAEYVPAALLREAEDKLSAQVELLVCGGCEAEKARSAALLRAFTRFSNCSCYKIGDEWFQCSRCEARAAYQADSNKEKKE